MTSIKKPGRPPQSQLWFEDEHWQPSWAKAVKKHGGWNFSTGTLTPISKIGQLEKYDFGALFVADSICIAYEEGLVDFDTYVEKCFATRKDLEEFCDAMDQTDMEWMHERHHAAFSALGVNDDYIAGYPSVADYLREQVLTEMS